MAFCYIGLGANLNDPVTTIKLAMHELSLLPQSRFVSASALYMSKPMGPADQPDYVNAAVLIETQLTAHQVFEQTCMIEQQHGRVRDGEHWGPRTLDLDILLFDQDIINDEQLTVPHYGIKEREFVIYPLLDISPNLVLPCGTRVESLTETISLNDMVVI